jgi:hypothetical protein
VNGGDVIHTEENKTVILNSKHNRRGLYCAQHSMSFVSFHLTGEGGDGKIVSNDT